MRERLKSDGIEGTYTTDPFGSDCIRPPDPCGSDCVRSRITGPGQIAVIFYFEISFAVPSEI